MYAGSQENKIGLAVVKTFDKIYTVKRLTQHEIKLK